MYEATIDELQGTGGGDTALPGGRVLYSRENWSDVGAAPSGAKAGEGREIDSILIDIRTVEARSVWVTSSLRDL